jgi:hypothetical protein
MCSRVWIWKFSPDPRLTTFIITSSVVTLAPSSRVEDAVADQIDAVELAARDAHARELLAVGMVHLMLAGRVFHNPTLLNEMNRALELELIAVAEVRLGELVRRDLESAEARKHASPLFRDVPWGQTTAEQAT